MLDAGSVMGAARRMDDAAQTLPITVAGRRQETAGTVRVTSSQVAAVYLLPPLLARMQAQEPSIRIDLLASNQLTDLLRREADIAVRTDDQIAYGRLVAEGAGIGFVARYNAVSWPGVVPVLEPLRIPSLPCWLAVHREIRGSPVVRRVFDFLAEAIPAELARIEALA